MRSEDLFKVLAGLDSEDDSQWTLDGLPRMDVLADLGIPGMTREQLKKLAPQFTRTSRELPDLEALRAERDKKLAEAEEAERLARELRESAAESSKQVAQLDQPLNDQHMLTRQNQQWLASQTHVSVARHEVKRHIDAAIRAAGGPKQIGGHPIEINEAARIRTKRRNYTLPQKPEAR